jgi:hypothetical protein
LAVLWILATRCGRATPHRWWGEILDAAVAEDASDTSVWDRLCLTAELDAAGQPDAAVATLGEILDEDRTRLLTDATSLSSVFHSLIWYTVLLDRSGRPHDADAARREALGLARRLAATGEPRNWCGGQHTRAAILLGSQAQDEEPVIAGEPRPAFGVYMSYWSRDLRARYIKDIGAPRCGASAGDQGGTLQDAAGEVLLPEVASLRRRLAIRTAVYRLWHCGHRFLEPTLPAFDNSVAAARRLHAEAGVTGRPALARALTDRAMLLIAGARYPDALADYEEALNLLGAG